ncbi:hypothetical protein IWQ45_002442 [Aquimarina sp. EL_32]|nr:hypothetical protein [Aquimarina sp. EL_32]
MLVSNLKGWKAASVLAGGVGTLYRAIKVPRNHNKC